MNQDRKIWDGIFNEFPESQADEVWNSDRWTSSVFDSLNIPDPAAALSGLSFHDSSTVHEYPLPPIVALLAGNKEHPPLRILDFGGGGGHAYLSCITSVPDANRIEYHIVESRGVCEKGRKAYSEYENIIYHQALPLDGKGFDLVHVAASLHYIQDWRGLVKKLIDYNPKIVFLNALNAGNIKTFVTYQNYYRQKIPVWFWDVREILEFFESLNYSMIYKSILKFKFFGKFQPLPMKNFPLEYRLENKCNLMFQADNIGM